MNGTDISLQRYVDVLRSGARSTFYHRQPPEGEMEEFRVTIGNRLIDGELLLQEAVRRQIAPDDSWVEERIEALQARYGDQPDWKEKEATALTSLRQQLADQSRVQNLEKQLRDVGPPSKQQLEAYYAANPEKFTTPERTRASMILLRVEASAAKETWQAAIEEAERLESKLRENADFGELARLHSQDPSADEGGDLGDLHRGTLGSMAQEALDALDPGEISGPVQLLDGIALFRLENRYPGELRPLDAVAERAAGLWRREEEEVAQQRLLESLRADAEIEIRDPAYLALLERRGSEGGAASVAE